MTVSFQNPQIKPVAQPIQTTAQQPIQAAQQPIQQNAQATEAQNIQNTCACTAYAKNPYLCAFTPVSYLVVPQGQLLMPCTPAQNLTVQPIQQIPTHQNVNYNTVTPQLDGNSNVFKPTLETKSGKAIATATAVSRPLEAQESQIVYQGPVRIINPQITPIEQLDNEIDKQYKNYFVNKAQTNEELKQALNSSTKKKRTSLFINVLKGIGTVLAIYGIYKYRGKIPILKNIFK